MRPDLPVSQLMSTDVRSVQVDQKLSDVRGILEANAFHHLPVCHGRKLMGILSSADLGRLTLEAWGTDRPSADAAMDSTFTLDRVMTAEPTALFEDASLYEACDVLANGEFHSLPVINRRNELVGIVTTTDLVRYLLASL